MACCITVVFTCLMLSLLGLSSFAHAEDDFRTTRRYGRGGRRGGGYGYDYNYRGFGGYNGNPFDYRQEIDGGSAEEAAHEGKSVESAIPQKVAPNEVHATLGDDSASSKKAVVDGNHSKSQTPDRLANSHNNDAHALAKEAVKESDHGEPKGSEQMVEAAEKKGTAAAEDDSHGVAKETMQKNKQVESERPQQFADNQAVTASKDGHA